MKALVFVSEYPPIGNTSAVHYFLKEWAACGDEVFVIYNCNRLMFPLYKFAARQDKRTSAGKAKSYEYEGVRVFMVPSTRFIPGKRWLTPHSRFFAKRAVKKYLKENCPESFDVIINHFCSNNYWLAEDIIRQYDCPVFSVFHDCDTRNAELAGMIAEKSDGVGSRSKRISEYLREKAGYRGEIYQVISGVPVLLKLFDPEEKKPGDENGVLKICCIGKLIKRKHIDDVIRALHEVEDKVEYTFDIVGEGLEKSSLEALADSYGMRSRVTFHGAVAREKVFDIMSASDCMIMPSTEETLGLVYLEAMASGCIPVGTRGEGIDGVIEDGVNGFLVNPRDVGELADIILKISAMNAEERKSVLRACREVVSKLRDDLVARDYRDKILQIIEDYRITQGELHGEK